MVPAKKLRLGFSALPLSPFRINYRLLTSSYSHYCGMAARAGSVSGDPWPGMPPPPYLTSAGASVDRETGREAPFFSSGLQPDVSSL